MKSQPAKSPWSNVVRQMLLDGKWHDRMTVLRTAAAQVPPSVAYRKAESHRYSSSRKRGGPGVPERVRGDTHDAVQAGSRQMVSDVLYAMYQGGNIEKDVENDRIRATPKALEAWGRREENVNRSVELPPLSLADARVLYGVLAAWSHEHRSEEPMWSTVDDLRALVQERMRRY